MTPDLSQARRRVAIVGGGISGLAAAHDLAGSHDVTLIEAEPRLGGHARTVMAGRNGDLPVDSGFIVYNRVNYPNLVALFEALDVPVIASDMSFAASIDGGRIEYSTRTPDTMFAQRSNLLRPAFLGMVRDIYRFHARAVATATDPDVPLRDLLDALGTGPAFRDWFIGPVAGAIWSTPSADVLDFPARALVRFFDNHNLLSANDQHPWFTVAGGSVQYVDRLRAHLTAAGTDIRLGAPVAGIRRMAAGPELRQVGGEWEAFDEVVLATHSDDALSLLSDARPEERARLSAVRYQDNRAVLHGHAGAMPKRRKVWASWNYTGAAGADGRLGLTYWMNRLQSLPADDPVFSTLNPGEAIPEAAIYDDTVFRHPVYDLAMARAVAELRAANGTDATWFCGAWMRNGFHEDGYASALDVTRAMATRGAGALAAE